jgi:hypothetical protein
MLGVIYAAVALPQDQGYARLEQAVSALLDVVNEDSKPEILWKLQYQQRACSQTAVEANANGACIALPALPADLVLNDSVLLSVKQVWRNITSEGGEMFMKFGAREGLEDDD